jgi:hypothetical protein
MYGMSVATDASHGPQLFSMNEQGLPDNNLSPQVLIPFQLILSNNH